ncbi:MAG: hypothetical protein GY870_02335 [archaeon]|nr:hypothetical protein [archaeon]
MAEFSAIFYNKILSQDELRINSIQQQYSKAFQQLPKKNRITYEINNTPIFQGCWNSYLGAISGVLKSFGYDYDINAVGGYSGYIFLTNVIIGRLCASGMTCHNAWDEIWKGTSLLGWEIECYADNLPFPNPEVQDISQDDKRAIDLFNRVKMDVDEYNRPIVVWGLVLPEYGIVKGYHNKSYLVSTYRRLINQPDTPVLYNELQAPGLIQALFFKKNKKLKIKTRTLEADKIVIKRALFMAEGKGLAKKGYIAGPSAYDEWAEVLKNGDSDVLSYHGNSYIGICLHENKQQSAIFLNYLADRYQNKQIGDLLAKSARSYQQVERYLKDFNVLFPFAMDGKMTMDKRKDGARLLSEGIKESEIEAINYLKKINEII